MAGIIGSVELRVTPEQLNIKAGEVEKHVAQMKAHFETMKSLVEKSSAYWVGEAGDLHRNNYEEQIENIEVMIRRLNEHPGDLRTIAQTYTDVELRVNESIIQELPGNVL